MNNNSNLRISLSGPVAGGHRQRGVALIVAMVILVVLTAMGVSGMRTANLEEHFAGNLRDQSRAFGAAESALRSGEAWLAGLTARTLPATTCAAPPCDIFLSNALEDGYFAERGLTWWKGAARNYLKPSGAANLGDVSAQPRFVIEELPSVPRAGDSATGDSNGLSSGGQYYYYRITALGQGGSPYTNVVLQSTYVNRYN